MNFRKFSTLVLLAHSLLAANLSYAANKPISGKFNKDLSGYKLIAISDDGSIASSTISGKSFSISPTGNKVSLNLIDSSNQYFGPIVAERCSGKSSTLVCTKTKVITSFRAGANLGSVKVASSFGLAKISNSKKYKASLFASRFVKASASGKPNGAGSLGLVSNSATKNSRRLHIRADSENPDEDLDGLPSAYDADDDGDGVLDNYDSTSTSSPPSSSASFHLFSNFKLDMAQSINVNTGIVPTTSEIDALLQSVQTLAVEVSGSATDTVEFDCGSLGYCSSGGTGRSNNQSFPDNFDSDGDGFGLLTKGPTGDFQLQTGATSSTIAAGDTYVQKVTDSSATTTEIPGMLNFIFSTTPAIKTVSIGGTTYTVDYASSPRKGARNNCFQVPSTVTGDVTIDIVAWRPQRPGISGAGEAAFVDLGNSRYTIDIPNGACSDQSGSGCASQGPGNCTATSYSTSDSNLTAPSSGGSSGDTIQDSKGDQDADAANTFSFTLNLSQCLSSARSGAVSWTAGQTLFLDLQARSIDGDNAAQKFCVTR